MRDKIKAVFEEVWREQKESDPPELSDATVLLDTGLDSLGIAIVVTRLDEEMGFDPFSIAADAYYPQTFGEFVDFYEKHAPAQ
jgi:acyl carrier protein